MGRRRMLAGIGTLAALSTGATAARAQTAQESAVTTSIDLRALVPVVARTAPVSTHIDRVAAAAGADEPLALENTQH
jgi:hypothetical protein